MACAMFPFYDGTCDSFAAVYDKGAHAFAFPADVGVRIGKGTPNTHVIIQIHYLVGEEEAKAKARAEAEGKVEVEAMSKPKATSNRSYIDNSGYKLKLLTAFTRSGLREVCVCERWRGGREREREREREVQRAPFVLQA